jgi:cyanocobalamin reductase (cyanide-eliminating) / alkylcobalamin dealkylase
VHARRQNRLPELVPEAWPRLTDAWHAASVSSTALLADAGLDLLQPFDAARIAREPGCEPLDDPARRDGLLVGNTRALWPRFVAAYRADRELAAASDPLNRYVEAVFARVFPDDRVWFGHRRYEGAFLPLQRIAVAAGLGSLAPTQLVIHPIYGPWFALRAVVLRAGANVAATTAPASPTCQCTSACTNALAEALAARGPDAWRAWLAVRDACPVGREHRYGEHQLRYHYTRARDAIR